MKTLILNKEIYSYSSILKAKSIYSDCAKIHVFTNRDNWLLIFSNCCYNPEQTIREFENYLIGLENA